jgi:hypothetical protein
MSVEARKLTLTSRGPQGPLRVELSPMTIGTIRPLPAPQSVRVHVSYHGKRVICSTCAGKTYR